MQLQIRSDHTPNEKCFFLADLKKNQTNQGNLGGSNLWVAVHFLAKFYHYYVFIHMRAVHILMTNTDKKEFYRTDPGN